MARFYIRTTKNTGISVGWLALPFVLTWAVTYWLVLATVLFFVYGVKISVWIVRWVYDLLSHDVRPGRNS